MYESTETVTRPIFPMVSFTNLEGKEFVIQRDRVIHTETVEVDGELDPTKTFVNFTSPNPKSKGVLHAVVDMPLSEFRETVLRPAYEGNNGNT